LTSTDSPILQHALLLEEAEQIARVGSFEWHIPTDESIWTPGLWRIFGLEPRDEGPSGEEFLSWIHPDDREEQRRLQQAMMENPESWQSNYRLVRPNGEIAYMRTRGVLAWSDGHVVMRGTVQDVTTERHADEALRRGERRFRALTKNAPVGIVELDTEGRCVFVNERFCELSGIPLEKTSGWGWMGALHPDERETVLADGNRAARDGQELVREHRMIRADGKLVWISARTARLRDESGAIEGYIVTCTDITELKEANSALEEAEARFANAFEEAPIGMALVSPEGGFLRVNRELVRITAYTQEQLLEMSFKDISHPEELDESLDLVRRLLAGEIKTFNLERRHLRANGQFAWIDVSVSAVRDDSGPLYMVAQVEDVTERRRADEAVRAAEARFRSAFDGAPIGMAITSLEGRFEHVNPALCEITGYAREQLEGTSFQSITHAEDVGDNNAAVEQLISGALSVYRTEKRYIHADGHLVPIEISSTLVRDCDGAPLNFLTQIQDITERKLFEGRLQHLADHDSLTGLFNRRRFEEELARELALAERHGNSAALLAIDLDNFKYINDSLGHSIGDELIARVGEALFERLRRTDVLARLGGDEFAVILPHAGEDDASRVAGALLDSVSAVDLQPTGSHKRQVTASIGISIFEPGSGLGAEELLVEADIAMYDAKEAGRGRATVYSASEDRGERMQARITWADRIREGLADDRFVLYAQEIQSLSGDPVPRFELLLRMVSEDGEVILPGSFLHVAERFDLIQEIDAWVVQGAARILAEHQAAGHELALSVNLSAKSITDPNMPAQIARALEDAGADGRGLCIEVTETAAIVNVDRAKSFASAVAALGCELSLDDFGAGFASFYYLKHLSFDVLKIDGEFVRELTTSHMNQLLVKSVVDIARGLGKRTVAEFVGDEPTLEMLRGMGVDFAQGFHVGKPQPLEAAGLLSHIETRSSGSNPARS
jgi:diguanylate cyclase (GGDEF)-like protein/PAS domain S-box-containing protein